MSNGVEFAKDGVDDAANWQETTSAMGALGIEPEEKTGFLKVIAGVLAIGNLKFNPKLCGLVDPTNLASSLWLRARCVSSSCEPCAQSFLLAEYALRASLQTDTALDSRSGGGADDPMLVSDPKLLARVASLFGVDAKALETKMTSRLVKAGGEEYTVALKPSECLDARDALAQGLYAPIGQFQSPDPSHQCSPRHVLQEEGVTSTAPLIHTRARHPPGLSSTPASPFHSGT